MNNMKKAHQLAKEIKKQYPEVDYRFQLSLCMAFVAEQDKERKEENKRVMEQFKPVKVDYETKARTIAQAIGAAVRTKELKPSFKAWGKGLQVRLYINFNIYGRGVTSIGYIDLKTDRLSADPKTRKMYSDQIKLIENYLSEKRGGYSESA
jgi:hypothetical protein